MKSAISLQNKTDINYDGNNDQMCQLLWQDCFSFRGVYKSVTWIVKNLHTIISNNSITRTFPRLHMPLKPWIIPGVVRILGKRDLMHKRQKHLQNDK